MTAMSAEQDMNGPTTLFCGLDDAGQLDVLRALGAQCRIAVRGASDAGAEFDLGQLDPRLRDVFPHATGTFEDIVQGRAWHMPGLPSCAPCRAVVAGLLCGLAVRAGRASGLSEELIAHHCRQAASQVAAL